MTTVSGVIPPHKVPLLQAVKDHAIEHYNDGGWDVIVECYSDEMISDEIGRARTTKGAIAKFGYIVDVMADRQADAINSAF